MTSDPRAALGTLVAALERHLEAAAGKRGEEDPVVVAAYRELAIAFEAYDDALLDAYDEVTPLEVFQGEDDDDSDFDEPDDVDGSSYTGLDDEEYDEDDEPDDTAGPVDLDANSPRARS
ncbi:hypothetical protein [Angustibacter aerolatus]